jgi:CubicO group peptidase (beta-lactamase class C family)
MSGYIERAEIPGLVTLVSRKDEVHVEPLGTFMLNASAPMQRDTIFRIASLTKPITAAAAMLLVEECRLRLDDPVDGWLPELANRRVLRTLDAELDDTVPARRAITVRDLLTQRLGIGSVMAPAGTYPIQRAIAELQIGGDGPPRPAQCPPTDEWMRRLGSLPLLHHPGEQWSYHIGLDVVGVLVSRVSGRSFGAFLQERIFEPLGMRDTGFRIAPEKQHRFPACYQSASDGRGLTLYDGVEDSQWSQPPPFESGGGGLVSTVDDYYAFCHMMLNKGRHGAARILSRASVELMTTDQLTPEQRESNQAFFDGNSGWGFGMGVTIKRDDLASVPGRFGWAGGVGTSAYTDPHEHLIGILMTQRHLDSQAGANVHRDFWTTTYQAIAD